MVEDTIVIGFIALTLAGGVLGMLRAWLGWPLFMCAQVSCAIYMMAIGDWITALINVGLMWLYTWGWLHIMSARIVDDGILVEVDE